MKWMNESVKINHVFFNPQVKKLLQYWTIFSTHAFSSLFTFVFLLYYFVIVAFTTFLSLIYRIHRVFCKNENVRRATVSLVFFGCGCIYILEPLAVKSSQINSNYFWNALLKWIEAIGNMYHVEILSNHFTNTGFVMNVLTKLPWTLAGICILWQAHSFSTEYKGIVSLIWGNLN